MNVKPAVGAVVAVLLFAGGAALWWHGRPVAFGWFAYGPADDRGASVFGGPSLVTTEQLVGVVLAAVGALLLAGLVGYLLGRRRPRG